MKISKLSFLPLLIIPLLASCNTEMNEESFLNAYNEKKDYSYFDGVINISTYNIQSKRNEDGYYSVTKKNEIANLNGFNQYENIKVEQDNNLISEEDYYTKKEADGNYYETTNYGEPVLISEEKAIQLYNEELEEIKKWALTPVENLINIEGSTNKNYAMTSEEEDDVKIDYYSFDYEVISEGLIYNYSYLFTTSFLLRQYVLQIEDSSQNLQEINTRTFMYY